MHASVPRQSTERNVGSRDRESEERKYEYAVGATRGVRKGVKWFAVKERTTTDIVAVATITVTVGVSREPPRMPL